MSVINPLSFLRIQRIILTCYGLWPHDFKFWFLYHLHCGIICFAVAFLFFFSFLIDELLSKTLDVEDFFLFFTQMMLLMKLLIFAWKRKEFQRLLTHLPAFDYTEQQEDMVRKPLKFADRLVKNYLAVCFSGAGFYSLSFFTDKDETHILPFKGLLKTLESLK